MATELSELTNLLKTQNQNNNSNFKSLENAIDSSFLRMTNSLSGIRTIEEQQLAVIKDTASKEIMGEQLIEKDIAKGDREIVNSLKEIFHVLQEQFDFDRDTENKRRLSEHVQKDYQSDTASKVDMSGVEGLLKKLIETTENISSSSGGGLGGAIVGGLSAFMAGRFIPLLAGAIGIAGVMKLLSKMDTSLLGTTEAIIDMGKSLMNMLPSFGGGSSSSRPMSQEEFARERIPKQLGGESARREGGPSEQPMTSDTFERQRIPKSMEGRWERAKADISEAAEKTGVDPGVLTKIAHFESKFNPEAMPITKSGKKLSSAHGYGQFLEGTWDSTVKTYGEKYGLDTKNPMKYRHDPKVQALMLAEFTKRNIEIGEKLGGKDPDANVYALHNLGEGGGSKFLKAMSQNPNAPISSVLSPAVIRGNPSLYKGGNISLSEAYSNMGKSMKSGEIYAKDIRGENKEIPKNQRSSATATKESNMVDVSDLRVKGGLKGQAFKGGETEEGTLNLARSIQAQEKDLPGGLNRFSSFNDAYHKHANPKSKHTKGLALDFSLKDSKYSSEASNYVKEQILNSGLSEKDFKIINEYKNPSKHATGGHIHVNFANKEAAERYAAITKGEKVSPTEERKSYAKMEKQIPEGGKYKEEESEMEETDEPILEEKVSEPKSKLTEEKPNFDKKIDSGYKGFFEDMVSHLEKMVSFTEEIKNSNKKMADTESEKQSDTASKESEKTQEEPSYSLDQSSKEANLVSDKEQLSNIGVNPFGNISQSIPGAGIFNQGSMGGFGQNPFGTIQNVLGGIGSAVSTGQQIGNIGKYGMGGGMFGGIGAAQGAIGGIQGVMGQMGQQSPMLGGLGQVLGSVGSVAGSIQGMKNMGGAGGILGGINAASGVIGAAGNIFNAGKGILGGLGGLFGGESSEKTGNMINDNPMLKGMANSVGDFFGIRSVGKERTDDLSDPSKWHPIESKGIGDDAAAVKSKNDSASLIPSVSTDGFSLEGMSKDVEAGKEEMMMPTGGGEPVVVNAGGGGGGGAGGGGGGNSQDNPSSTGVMGIDIGVRNEEATLMRAQFGSVRIV